MMMVALLAVFIAVLKTTILEALRVGGVLPDLFLALVVYSSLLLGARRGLAAGALVGTIVALASADGAGIYPALYAVAGWLSGLAWERTIRRSLTTEFLALAALGAVIDGILLAREGGFAGGVPIALVTLVLPSAVATGVAGPLAGAVAGRLVLPLHVGIPARVRGQQRPA